MKLSVLKALLLLGLLSLLTQAYAFCGFYVGKADTGLFNESSQVVYVRDGLRNVVTMSSDFKGDAKDFAMVIPVPSVLRKEQISVVNPAVMQHLDAYSAPRLVEYFDPDPCAPKIMRRMMAPAAAMSEPMAMASPARRAADLGVKIEARYTVAEYDILLLSAKQSGGLVTWLREQGYKLPKGAEPVVGSYLKQDMKFFVAKVNLKELDKSGYTRLRPIRVAYDYKKFMLPIRLGTVNAQGKQELFVYALTRNGRVETTNYRTVKLPTNVEVPPFIKDNKEFGSFYRDMFRTAVNREKGKAVFLEYAWDMNWCDPCAADPLNPRQLRELGAFWVDANDNSRGGAQDVFITRLHVRYDRQTFPEDLMFQVTGNRDNFQGRYIIRHAFEGEASCPAGKNYLTRTLPQRKEKEIQALANLTGRNINDVRRQAAAK